MPQAVPYRDARSIKFLVLNSYHRIMRKVKRCSGEITFPRNISISLVGLLHVVYNYVQRGSTLLVLIFNLLLIRIFTIVIFLDPVRACSCFTRFS